VKKQRCAQELSTKTVDNLSRSCANAVGNDANRSASYQENRKYAPRPPAIIGFMQHIKRADNRPKKQSIYLARPEFQSQVCRNRPAN